MLRRHEAHPDLHDRIGCDLSHNAPPCLDKSASPPLRRFGFSGGILRRVRDGLDALNEVGVTERALRFEQVQYLEYQFVYGAIFGGEAEQPLREIKTLL